MIIIIYFLKMKHFFTIHYYIIWNNSLWFDYVNNNLNLNLRLYFKSRYLYFSLRILYIGTYVIYIWIKEWNEKIIFILVKLLKYFKLFKILYRKYCKIIFKIQTTKYQFLKQNKTFKPLTKIPIIKTILFKNKTL